MPSSPDRTGCTPSHTGIDGLSSRQREVLELVSKGLTNDEIGRTLRISATTVRTHVGVILSRLDVTNRTEAAASFAARAASVSRVDEVLRRPAVVVLPFVASDPDPRARRAARAVASDLASLFARWCW